MERPAHDAHDGIPGAQPPSGGPGQGRVLRLKQGYNPNSSSIGSIVFALPASLLGLTAAFAAAAGLVCAVLARGRTDPEEDPAQEQERTGAEGPDEAGGG